MNIIFVEGFDDSNFIEAIFNKKNEYKIIPYAGMKNSKVDGIIITANKCKDTYVFLADLDQKSGDTRKNELLKQYKELDPSKIFFSIQEIESWYLSGISEDMRSEYRIKDKMLKDTQVVNKEKFENIFKDSRKTLLEIKFNILEEFDIEKAKSRNASFNTFLENAI